MKNFLCLLIAFGIMGCSSMQSALNPEKPSVTFKNVSIDDLSLTSVILVFDLEIGNPYSLPLPITQLNYSLNSGGSEIFSGKKSSQEAIEAKKSKVLSFPVEIPFTKIIGLGGGIQAGAVVPYTANLDMSLDLPLGQKLNVPLSKAGEFPIPTVPSVKLGGISWEKLSLQEAKAVLSVEIESHNQFPVELTDFSYALELAGNKVGENKLSRKVKLSNGKPSTLKTDLSLSPVKVGFSFFQMLLGKEATYRMKGLMEVDTDYKSFEFPYDSEGNTEMKNE